MKLRCSLPAPITSEERKKPNEAAGNIPLNRFLPRIKPPEIRPRNGSTNLPCHIGPSVVLWTCDGSGRHDAIN